MAADKLFKDTDRAVRKRLGEVIRPVRSTYPVQELPIGSRWRSPRSGPHKSLSIAAPSFKPRSQGVRSTVRPTRLHYTANRLQGLSLPETCLAADLGRVAEDSLPIATL